MGVVADRVVVVAALPRPGDHRLERVLAVRPGRVGVEVAAQVAERDEVGQLAGACGGKLAAVLPQLGRDPRVPQELVDLLLGREAVLLAGLDDRHGVLGDREPAPNRLLAQRDVVVLGAGEMLEQVSVARRLDDAEVEPQPVVRDDRRLRRPLRCHVDDPVQGAEVVDELLRIGRRRDDVEVAHGLAHAPGRAGRGDLDRRRMPVELLDHGLQLRERRAEQRPARAFGRPGLGERLCDLLLGARADARVASQLARLCRGLERRHRRDPELLPDPAGRLRPEPRKPHEGRDLGRHLGLALGQRVDLAVVDDLDDLALDRLPDPLQSLRLAVERQLRHRRRRLPDARGRPAIGVDPERIDGIELEQVGEKLELLRELVVSRERCHVSDHRHADARDRLPADLRRARQPRAHGPRACRLCCARATACS